MELTTSRLHLRPMGADDLPALMGIWTDPAVTRFVGGPREAEALHAGLSEDLLPNAPPLNLWPVVENASGAVVGHCGILDKEVDGCAEYELIYIFAQEAWGRGYATEIGVALRDHAFQVLGLARLVSLIEPENAASRRVAEKVGMRHEKDIVRPSGRTMCLYALYATERHLGDSTLT